MLVEKLIGVWELKEFKFASGSGDCFFPYGNNPLGRLIYEKSGFVSGMMSRTDRKLLSTADFRNMTEDDRKSLSDGFNAYSGRYELLEDRILHKIDISIIPNQNGTVEERFFQFAGNTLVLTTRPVKIRDKDYHYHLIWEKISN